jgi:hypothetical protein
MLGDPRVAERLAVSQELCSMELVDGSVEVSNLAEGTVVEGILERNGRRIIEYRKVEEISGGSINLGSLEVNDSF